MSFHNMDCGGNKHEGSTGNEVTRSVVTRAHEARTEIRNKKRLEAQSRGRKIDLSEFNDEVSESESKALRTACKMSKISTDQLKRLSKALTTRVYADDFLGESGCLHSLVGFVSGKDWNKQLLALHCLANLSANNIKIVQIARSSGPYLITHISGSNKQLCELSCTTLVNLTISGDELALKVLLNQELFPNLLLLTQSRYETIKELSYQVLYNLLTHTADLEGESLNSLTEIVIANLSRRSPIHLLWVLFSLSSNQMLHGVLHSDRLLDTLLQAATYEIFQKCDSRPLVKVLTPIVRILANLSAGPGSVEVALHLIRHPDFPAIVTALLSTNYSSLCQETVWLLANIVNNENVRVQEEFVDMDLMDKLEYPAVTAITRLDPYLLSR